MLHSLPPDVKPILTLFTDPYRLVHCCHLVLLMSPQAHLSYFPLLSACFQIGQYCAVVRELVWSCLMSPDIGICRQLSLTATGSRKRAAGTPWAVTGTSEFKLGSQLSTVSRKRGSHTQHSLSEQVNEPEKRRWVEPSTRHS